MILLDTNILSELMRIEASRQVVTWLDQQVASNLFICAVTRAEIELGLYLLPNGKRKDNLKQAAEEMFNEFTGRCLVFDDNAAKYYGRLVAHRQNAGRPVNVEDAQIAAIALTHGMKLATRNTKDFTFIEGLELINPHIA